MTLVTITRKVFCAPRVFSQFFALLTKRCPFPKALHRCLLEESGQLLAHTASALLLGDLGLVPSLLGELGGLGGLARLEGAELQRVALLEGFSADALVSLLVHTWRGEKKCYIISK
jgi:hypothetical protein